MPASVDAVRLPLDQIRPSALNPRRSFNHAADAELLESIRAHGILTPLLVRCIERDEQDTYEVVAGHRRYNAALELGLETVPVTIRELTDDQARETAIIENLHRENLAPPDEAESYQALLALPGTTPASVAAAVGKSPAYIGRRLKLLSLVDAAKHALRDGRLDVARAELLAKLSTELQAKALDEAVWLPLYTRDDQDGTGETLEPLSHLREWVDRRTRLTLSDLAGDAETQELFPEAADAVCRDLAEPTLELLEVALDRFGRSPAKADIPSGVLRLNVHFREVTGKRCKAADRAVVVFGERKGDVVFVCRDKKGCTTHWPPKDQAAPGEKANPRPSWEVQEAERKRQHAIFERIVPDLRKAIVLATAKVETTPAALMPRLDESHQPEEVKAAVAACGGKLTLDNFARVWAVLDGFSDLCNIHGAERAIKNLKLAFDLKKAMKAAEAALAVETAAAKAETKKVAGKPAKTSRRVA